MDAILSIMYMPKVLYLVNILFDNLFYLKILIKESKYFEMIYKYFYPIKKIIYARLHNGDTSVDITTKFISIIENGNNHIEIKWDKLIEGENITVGEDLHLDMKYTQKENVYKIVYPYISDSITFPPYKDAELIEYNENKKYKNNILYAEIIKKNGNEDITMLIKEYSGPLNDFYKNKGMKINPKLIKDDNGSCLWNETEKLVITNSYADEFEFKDDTHIDIDIHNNIGNNIHNNIERVDIENKSPLEVNTISIIDI